MAKRKLKLVSPISPVSDNTGKTYRRHAGAIYWRRGRAYVRVAVPVALRSRFGHVVEKWLGTGDVAKARDDAPEAVATIRAEFRAVLAGMPGNVKVIEHVHATARHAAMQAALADPSRGVKIGTADVTARARAMLVKLGIQPAEPTIAAAEIALVEAASDAAMLWAKGIMPPEPAPLRISASVAQPAASEGGETVPEAIEEYCTARLARKITDKTKHQVRQSGRLFAEHVNGAGVLTITRKHAVTFLERLAAISPRYARDPNAAKMTLAEIEKKYPAGNGDGLAVKTINRHATALRTLFDRLRDRDVLPLEHSNPFAETHRKRGDDDETGTYLPMRDEEIAALLKAAPLATDRANTFADAVGWLVALAAYTGARAGELMALTTTEVCRKDGISFIAIPKGKTKNARRFVPLHPALIRAGFLKYVAKCEGKLFGIDAPTLAKRFPAFRREHIEERDRVNFHSLRKSFVSKLEHAGYGGDQIAPLVGHAGGKRSFTLDIYNPEGPLLAQRAKVVKKIVYAGVKLG